MRRGRGALLVHARERGGALGGAARVGGVHRDAAEEVRGELDGGLGKVAGFVDG